MFLEEQWYYVRLNRTRYCYGNIYVLLGKFIYCDLIIRSLEKLIVGFDNERKDFIQYQCTFSNMYTNLP